MKAIPKLSKNRDKKKSSVWGTGQSCVKISF